MTNFRISDAVLKEIIAQAEEGYPNEICGIIASSDGRVGDTLYKMQNVAEEQREAFFMAPEEQLKVFKSIRQSGKSLYCIYHSHIDVGAYMSERDRAMAFYKNIYYFVVSVRAGKVDGYRAFYYTEDELIEVETEVV